MILETYILIGSLRVMAAINPPAIIIDSEKTVHCQLVIGKEKAVAFISEVDLFAPVVSEGLALASRPLVNLSSDNAKADNSRQPLGVRPKMYPSGFT